MEMGERPDSTVDVVPHRAEWAAEFARIADALSRAVGDVALSVEHIGSTAIPGLAAKPTIDIMMVVRSSEAFLAVLAKVEALGFDHRPNNTMVGHDDHLFLRKVEDGQRTHHLHVLRAGAPEIEEYRRFRDALRQDPSLAREYEALKLELARVHASDRKSYVEAKSTWVNEQLRSLGPSRA
jgi:GrpB-like predicted nucleotidyltransferase (UPF0157 family)